jgi:CheY-like chemotaxis protein/anti-sigma regulatory factor (Ser/Thr protein kinase)
MPRILLVEDNEMNRDMLSRRLVRRGYDVVVAVDGSEGVRRAHDTRPDLVLMDMSLPVIDGWDATKMLKAAPETSNIPVVGLSAHAMAADEAQARAAGCDDFETKPVELERLLGKIEALLARGRQLTNGAAQHREMQLAAATIADLAAIRAFIADAAAAVGLPTSVTEALVLAADEVSTNIVQHGYASACGPITIGFDTTSHSATLVIADHGTTFAPNHAPQPLMNASWDDRPIGGLGWHLVRSVVDELHYSTDAGGENRLTLIKYLSEKRQGVAE